jgi:hypothetical protein
MASRFRSARRTVSSLGQSGERVPPAGQDEPAEIFLRYLDIVLIDVHSHFWEYPKHFSQSFKAQARRARGDVEVDLTVRWDDYVATGRSCDKTIVFVGKAKLSGLWVPDREVAAYVAQHS